MQNIRQTTQLLKRILSFRHLKSKLFLSVAIFCFIGIIQNLQAQTSDSKTTVELSEIPDNPNYLQLPLEGIQWKLIGFVDIKKQQVVLSNPKYCNNCYTFFLGSGKIKARTYSNTLSGNYIIDSTLKELKCSKLGGTKVMEHYDGEKYRELLSQNQFYTITLKGLFLYTTDSKDALLFNPLIIELHE